ncbi:hypothetical protein CU102_03790 [Phyllobacterium brassicacearum]|uniref:Uncharacterized protein n=1 Tax=Phyllobacterium brassicacearum TaxID=314235 RepID=A0A2P7BUU4_9HYPH|nr:hypothetical protein [Phyllobacterium brassicacearum]PSH70221.1 hypothetical protein CU102_03790 [Phyllobacterium brassicacearum]TDQ33891.1 hypothetical protein DEV91_10494 [Phyllobacterium brassicacearum]
MKTRKWWEELHPDLEEKLYSDTQLFDLLDDETIKSAYRTGVITSDDVLAARKEKRRETA